jgi:hypothetical protein
VRALSAADLLDLADRGEHLHPVDRALAMLHAVLPERTYDELARLSIGQRDALLRQLRRRTFGESIEAGGQCAACGERVEFSTGIRNLQPDACERDRSPRQLVERVGYRVAIRCLDSYDVAALAGCTDVALARRTLLARCMTRIEGPAGPVDADELPDELLADVAQAVGHADPQAEVLLDLCCPTCGNTWRAHFDIGRFLWAEVRAQAGRLLREVDTIARAYGWREADILRLPAARRAVYVDLALGAPAS